MPSEKKFNDDIERLLVVAADMQPLNHSDRLSKLIGNSTEDVSAGGGMLDEDELGFVAGGIKATETGEGNKKTPLSRDGESKR